MEKENLNLKDYVIEWCPNCCTEQVIYSTGITICPECGFPLLPCSLCQEETCATCPYGGTGGGDEAELKKKAKPPIDRKLAKKLRHLL